MGLELTTTRLEDAAKWAKQGRVERVTNWGRKFSLFTYPFVTACCGMEFMSVAAPKYDIARFGAEFPRFSPRQADLLIIVGTISEKQAPVLRRIWEQMTEPKWVIAFGVCASTGGFYQNYSTTPGAEIARGDGWIQKREQREFDAARAGGLTAKAGGKTRLKVTP